MSIYEISRWNGGISDYADRGIPGAFKMGTNLDIRKEDDSLTCGQALVDEGLDSSKSPSLSVSPSFSISSSPSVSPSASASTTPSPSASASPSASNSPSPSTTESFSVSLSPSPSAGLTTVFHDLIKYFVKASNGYTYGFGNTGYIYRRDSDAYWSIEYKDPDGEIKGAAEWYSNAGKTYLYWATDTNLNRKELPGRSDWNDVNYIDGDTTWQKQNLTPADSHMMREAGGSLIIANGSNLALVGYDESYINQALNLIPGNIARTIVERNGRTIAGTARAGDLDKGINGAIDTEVQLAQVGDDGELFFADMSSSIPVKRFPGGGKCNPGGVTNKVDQVNFFEWEQTALSWIDKQSVGNMSLWAMYDTDTGYGGIYSYGRKNKNHPFTMNLDHSLDVNELGAVISVNGTVLVSYYDGDGFGVMAVDSDTKATGTYEGLDFRSPVKKPANITPWKYAELLFEPLPAGCSIEFHYKINKTGSWIQALQADGTDEFTTENGKKAVFLIADEAEVIEPKIVLNPSSNNTPEVHRCRIYFE